MASTNTPSSKKGLWTDAEKAEFTSKVVNQLLDKGAKLDLNEINMPGRTPKALNHMLQKIRSGGDDASPTAGPSAAGSAKKPRARKPRTPAKTPKAPKRKMIAEADGGDDDGEDLDDLEVDEDVKPAKRPKVIQESIEDGADAGDSAPIDAVTEYKLLKHLPADEA